MTVRAPAHLGPAGRALWRRVTDEYPVAGPDALAVLEAAARQAQANFDLDAAIRRDGVTVVGSKGQPRLNPAIAEARQGRLALARLLDLLGLDDEDEVQAKPKSRQARRAAEAKWARHRRHLEVAP